MIRIPSDSALKFWAHSSAVERFSDKEEVEGSTPSVPTFINLNKGP